MRVGNILFCVVCGVYFVYNYRLHYKEYLVQLINVNNIDPIDTMNEDYILPVLLREKKEVPARQIGESDADYIERLRQVRGLVL